MNNNEKEIISEEEISLAPEKELKVIKNDTGAKKYPMILVYSKAENKHRLMQALCELKCPIVETIDFAKCIVCDLTKSEIEKIKKHNFVESVERNYKYDLLEIKDNHKNDSRLENHNITHKSLEALKACKKAKSKVKVAVFDTGIDKHPDLTIAGGVSFVGKGRTFTDSDGHGTKIAGIIASAENKDEDTKSIDLYAVKIFDDTGHTTTTSIIRAINWAIDNKIDIINMSFGIYYPSKLLKKYIDIATDSGIIIVAAVGNDGGFKDRNRIMYPAKYDGVIAVGSGDASGVSKFSNNSIDLDFVAPGTTISTDINGKYSNITGTSVSCAYITSMLASIWSINRTISSKELISVAKRSGVVQNANTSYVGYGEVNAETALTNISERANIINDKSAIYSADLLSSISDTPPLLATASNASYNPLNSCSSNDCYYDNFMPSAIFLDLFDLTEISYTQLEQGVWYEFIANEIEAHPGIDTGFYHIYTHGQSDTIGTLYDSRGNVIAYNEGDNTNSYKGFEISAELQYGETYYIYVTGINLMGESVYICIEPVTDDYGNSISSAIYLGDVYSQNFSVSGFLHNAIDYYNNSDLDYFCFRSSKDCIVKIFSEGSSDVYGTIYDENGVSIDPESFNITNDDFVLTCNIKSNKIYYIEISRLSDINYITKYTFNVEQYYKYPKSVLIKPYNPNYPYKNNFNNEDVYYDYLKELSYTTMNEMIFDLTYDELNSLRAFIVLEIYKNFTKQQKEKLIQDVITFTKEVLSITLSYYFEGLGYILEAIDYAVLLSDLSKNDTFQENIRDVSECLQMVSHIRLEYKSIPKDSSVKYKISLLKKSPNYGFEIKIESTDGAIDIYEIKKEAYNFLVMVACANSNNISIYKIAPDYSYLVEQNL